MSWHRSRTCCKQATFENSISGDRSPSVRHCLNSPMSSHLIIIVISLRFWCVYSVLARRHCYLLSAIKQRFVQFQSWDPLSFSISALWYFQLVWVFLYSVFPVFADSTRVSNTSPQGGYSEGASVLLSAYLLSSCVISQFSLVVIFFYQIWDSVQKPEAFKEAALSEFFNVSASVFWKWGFDASNWLIFSSNIKVEVTALSSYEEKEELFKEQVHWAFKCSIFSL